MKFEDIKVGEEYEFTHDTMTGWDKRVLLAILPDSYQDRYIVSTDIVPKGWTYMSEIRNINKPKFNDKKPSKKDYQTDQEYYNALLEYEDYLLNEEWSRNGADRAFRTWLIILALIFFGAFVAVVILF